MKKKVRDFQPNQLKNHPDQGNVKACRNKHFKPYLPVMLNSLKEIEMLPLDKLCREYKISQMGVFGSFAKGLQTPKSDIDVIVVWEDGYADIKVRENLINQLKKWSGRKIDLINYSPLMNPVVLHEIEKHGVEVGHG